MATRTRKVREIDVSGGVDERGRRINTDIPAEERRRVSAGKSEARKRLQKKKREAERKKDKLKEEDITTPMKRKRKKKKQQEDALLVEKPKTKKKKVAKSEGKKKSKDEDSPKRKKKRKKKTVGELIAEGNTEKARKKMERLQSKSLAVVDNIKDVQIDEVDESEGQLMPMSTFSSEVEFLNEYNHIYGTLGSIIRKLEERMTEKDSNVSSKDVYALMTMYSQMRETIADMRSIKDMNEQAEELAQLVFEPATKSAGEALINVYYKFVQIIRSSVEDPEKVEIIIEKMKIEMSDQATKLQDQFGIARSRILEVLNGGR